MGWRPLGTLGPRHLPKRIKSSGHCAGLPRYSGASAFRALSIVIRYPILAPLPTHSNGTLDPFSGGAPATKHLMDGGVHDTRIRFHGPPHCSLSFNTRWLELPTGDLPEKRRGANPTRSHERHREAPLREARRAAPDGARASAALSSSENSRFSRGTEPLRRKSYFFIFNPYSDTGTFSRIRVMPQPRIPNQSWPFRDVFYPPQFWFKAGSPNRRATGARDENLRAGVFHGGLRRVKEERKPRTVVSLTRRRPPYNQPGFHRAPAGVPRMARQEKWGVVNIGPGDLLHDCEKR